MSQSKFRLQLLANCHLLDQQGANQQFNVPAKPTSNRTREQQWLFHRPSSCTLVDPMTDFYPKSPQNGSRHPGRDLNQGHWFSSSNLALTCEQHAHIEGSWILDIIQLQFRIIIWLVRDSTETNSHRAKSFSAGLPKVGVMVRLLVSSCL